MFRLGLILATASFWFLIQYHSIGLDLSPDSSHYLAMAMDVLRDGPRAIHFENWPPGYPMFLGYTARVFHLSLWEAANILQAASWAILWASLCWCSRRSWVTGLFAVLVSGLFMSHLMISSGVATHLWSEGPFVALVSLGLCALVRFRSARRASTALGWAAICFALSWTVRFIGILSLPLFCLSCFVVIVSDFRYFLRCLFVSFFHILTALGVVGYTLWLNKVRFGYWIWSGHRPGHRAFMDSLHDFWTTGTSLTFPAGFHLGWVTGFLGVCLLLIGLMEVFSETRRLRSARWPLEWGIWSLGYSVAIAYLMTKYDIYGMERFVVPALVPLIMGVTWMLASSRSFWIRTVFVGLCISNYSLGLSREIVREWESRTTLLTETISPLYHEARFRKDPSFVQLKNYFDGKNEVFWIGRGTEFTGQIISGLFPCKPFYLMNRLEGLSTLVPAGTLSLISDASPAELSIHLSPQIKIEKIDRIAGLTIAQVSSKKTSKADLSSPLRSFGSPFTRGGPCGR